MDAQAELEARVGRAGEALRRRLEAAPTPAEATGESARRLGELIAALVAPEAPCPIFGRVPATACAALVSDGGPAPLYPDWMDVVAPVRPAVARLESVQLDESLRPAGSPLEAWTNRPGDTWQTVLPPTDNEVPRPSRLIAAFGPPATLPAAQATVAAAVIDRFIETIPDTHHDAAIAFDHELPTARAPQAILLAVPPVADQDLNGETLVGIVAETRQLVRARLADPAQVGPDATVLHLAALSAIGPGAIRVGRHVRRGS